MRYTKAKKIVLDKIRYTRIKILLRMISIVRVRSLNFWEMKVFSQNGEDGILEFIFHTIGTTDRFFVEIGVGDGSECNTRYLKERKGWKGVMIDSDPGTSKSVFRENVKRENINLLLEKYSIPQSFDLFSLDIDSYDYWVWDEMKHTPRVVVLEYNGYQPVTESKTISYDPDFVWDGTDYKGASLLALVRLGRKKGYTLVGCDSNGVNAFFVRDDVACKFKSQPIEKLYRPFIRCKKVDGKYIGYEKSDREWVMID